MYHSILRIRCVSLSFHTWHNEFSQPSQQFVPQSRFFVRFRLNFNLLKLAEYPLIPFRSASTFGLNFIYKGPIIAGDPVKYIRIASDKSLRWSSNMFSFVIQLRLFFHVGRFRHFRIKQITNSLFYQCSAHSLRLVARHSLWFIEERLQIPLPRFFSY